MFRRDAQFGGTISIHPDAPCVAWSGDEGAFAFDGRNGEQVTLTPGLSGRWLNPS